MKHGHAGFATLARQVRLHGELVTHTPLRIGGGRSYDAIGDDLPVVKDTLGRPVIPGSSLKGALRAYTETLLRTLKSVVQSSEKQKLSCYPLTEPCLSNDEVAAIKQEEDADSKLWEKSCWTCRLFGAPWLASRVLVKDLTVRKATWLDEFGHRDGVSINRDKGTAQSQKRYTFELVPEKTAFDFDLVVDGASDAELGLFLLALNGANNGQILLGGARSRGLGDIVLNVEWNAVEEITPSNALEVLGNRVTGGTVPTTTWSIERRDGLVPAFFHAIDLPEALIKRWQATRVHGGKETNDAE
ncbi:MAG: type III CRISPR-associated RAMP protein Csx7 [Anaerolineae bacterium]